MGETQKKVIIVSVAILVVAGLIVLAFIIRNMLSRPAAQPTVSPTPSFKARGLGNDKFGPRPRPPAAANVDVGVRTVPPPPVNPTPSGEVRGAASLAQAYDPGDQSQLSPIPPPRATASPRPSAAPTPVPLGPAPTFPPLPPSAVGGNKEVVVAYAKGETGKRQLYLRSLDREKDDQVVTSVFDDYGPAFSSGQKIAFYSNEEGPSDAGRARTKLKVVDLATGKVHPITGNLPGTWPVAWSSDGRKLAIPSAASVFVADLASGTSLQIPTGRNPGGISWAPGNLKFYFQAEAGGGTDLFEADAITAQARPVTGSPENESLPTPSHDGGKLAFLRAPREGGSGEVVVRPLGGGAEQTYDQSNGAGSYLFDLDFKRLLFSKLGGGRLQSLSGSNLEAVGDLADAVLVSWDRDYEHVLVLAGQDQQTLYSVELSSGRAEKIKDDIADSPQPGLQ